MCSSFHPPKCFARWITAALACISTVVCNDRCCRSLWRRSCSLCWYPAYVVYLGSFWTEYGSMLLLPCDFFTNRMWLVFQQPFGYSDKKSNESMTKFDYTEVNQPHDRFEPWAAPHFRILIISTESRKTATALIVDWRQKNPLEVWFSVDDKKSTNLEFIQKEIFILFRFFVLSELFVYDRERLWFKLKTWSIFIVVEITNTLWN